MGTTKARTPTFVILSVAKDLLLLLPFCLSFPKGICFCFSGGSRGLQAPETDEGKSQYEGPRWARAFSSTATAISLPIQPEGGKTKIESDSAASTHLNPYTALWTDAVMRAIQQQILEVIRHRCEAVPSAPS